jgi:hypothetical protein
MKTRTHTTNVYEMSRDTCTGCPATLHPRGRRCGPAESRPLRSTGWGQRIRGPVPWVAVPVGPRKGWRRGLAVLAV